jgi:hypothetical protein
MTAADVADGISIAAFVVFSNIPSITKVSAADPR